jgi:hypothetical protein
MPLRGTTTVRAYNKNVQALHAPPTLHVTRQRVASIKRLLFMLRLPLLL